MSHQRFPTLYQYEACPYCWKVRALLSYKGIPYETVEVHPLNKKELEFSPDYRKVPILVDAQGSRVTDSSKIMRHLDAQYPNRPVFGIGKEEDKWLSWADSVLVRALPPLIYGSIGSSLRSFDYISRVSKFSWWQQRIIKWSGALVMRMVARKSAKAQQISDPKEHFKTCLQLWAEAIGTQKFLGGDTPNGADLAVFGILHSVESLPAFSFVRANSTVYDWYQRASEGIPLHKH